MIRRLIDRYFIKQPRLRRWVTKLIEGDQETDIELFGTKLRINTIKENGYLRAARKSKSSSTLQDEIPVLLNLCALLEDGDSFVDVGANVGLFAKTIARMGALLPNLHVYAFEASPDTWSRLNYQAAAPLKVQQLAVSDHAGNLKFVRGAVSHVFTTLERKNAYSIETETETVDCARLDSMVFEGNSLVIKIDVEGQELSVLEGARGLFDAKRIKAVYLDGYDDDPRVLEFLSAYNFSFVNGRNLSDDLCFSLLAVRQVHANEGS